MIQKAQFMEMVAVASQWRDVLQKMLVFYTQRAGASNRFVYTHRVCAVRHAVLAAFYESAYGHRPPVYKLALDDLRYGAAVESFRTQFERHFSKPPGAVGCSRIEQMLMRAYPSLGEAHVLGGQEVVYMWRPVFNRCLRDYGALANVSEHAVTALCSNDLFGTAEIIADNLYTPIVSSMAEIARWQAGPLLRRPPRESDAVDRLMSVVAGAVGMTYIVKRTMADGPDPVTEEVA